MKNSSRTALLVLLFLSIVPGVAAQSKPVELRLSLNTPFRFVAYGDTRFTDPNNHVAANAVARKALVKGIADASPAFISIGGDLVYNGSDEKDWKVWDSETSLWRGLKIPVYPALGNHDLRGDRQTALSNYFERFPELEKASYYSVIAANTLLLVLDSSVDELTGPQRAWLNGKLDNLPADTDFVVIVLHHPPFTRSSTKLLGGGHSARQSEQALAAMLEARQQHMRARIVVFAGHVHNYERFEHNGVVYFVTGGGGAHPYKVEREPGDPLSGTDVNYHYLLVEVDASRMKITMNRLELKGEQATWTQPDSLTIPVSKVK